MIVSSTVSMNPTRVSDVQSIFVRTETQSTRPPESTSNRTYTFSTLVVVVELTWQTWPELEFLLVNVVRISEPNAAVFRKNHIVDRIERTSMVTVEQDLCTVRRLDLHKYKTTWCSVVALTAEEYVLTTRLIHTTVTHDYVACWDFFVRPCAVILPLSSELTGFEICSSAIALRQDIAGDKEAVEIVGGSEDSSFVEQCLL